jgi:hypothetical protein
LAGRYRIVSLLGKGGMGEVYRAEDLRLRQTVALKLLPPSLAADPARLARFHSEVRLARQVSHPNVCRVHDIGEAESLTFLTMEHVDGEDLASLLRRVGRLTAERAVGVGRQICVGLAAAHERGVLHRDLKPANVMIDGRGQARLTDFGLAVAAGDARTPLESAGTPAYMAPEQLEGGPLSEKTDLYALGLVLYETFTGRRAFEADSLPQLVELRHASSPTPPTRHVPDLDPRIERAILQCLESDPARRPASAVAVAVALSGPDALAAAVAAGETPSPEMVAAAGERPGLRPGIALALGALAVAAQLVAVGLTRRTALLDQIPFDKPPEALAERARAIAGCSPRLFHDCDGGGRPLRRGGRGNWARSSGHLDLPALLIDRYTQDLPGLHLDLRGMILSARQRKLRVVFSEGTSETILRASSLLMEEGIATPVLLGRESEVREAIERLRLGLSGAQIVEPARSPRFESYVDEYFRMRRRRGIMRAAAAQRVRQTDTFAALMLHLSDADMMIAGVSTHYVESLRTILEVIGPAPGVRRVSSHYLVLLPRGRSSSPTAPSTWTPTPRSWPRSLCLRPPRRGPSASSPASPCSPSPTSGAWTTPTRGRSGGPRRSRRRRPPASSSTARCS